MTVWVYPHTFVHCKWIEFTYTMFDMSVLGLSQCMQLSSITVVHLTIYSQVGEEK